MGKEVEFNVLVGKVIEQIYHTDDEIRFKCSDGSEYLMHHEQDCCESVYIKELNGDFEDMLHSPILSAVELSSAGDDNDYWSSTWTFYKLQTEKGYMDITWFGESNGYYSERVDFVEMIPARS